MDAKTTRTTRAPVLRSEPDATRPAVSTAVAAARKQLSRYYIAELVRQGKLDGYGIRRREGGRVRWYVYQDVLPPDPEATDSGSTGFSPRELLRHLREARKHSLIARDELDSAHLRLLDVIDQMTNAVYAACEDKKDLAIRLLLEAQRARSDEERHLLMARKHETDAEKLLEKALWDLLQLGEEVEPHVKGDARFTLSSPETALEMLDSGSFE